MEFTSEENWSSGKKILFRFACLYILLYTLPEPYDAVPGISVIGDYYDSIWNALGVWFGSSILSIEEHINTEFTGSGDRLIDYIHLLIYVLFTIAGTIIWSVADRHRKNYNKLVYWIRLHLRYYLFATLFAYGIVKVIKTQFPFPDMWRFLQPFGEASPMGLAWTFMGFSKSYTVFAGLMEIFAAVLFLFRRTTTLGALVSLGVMTNVVVMNFSYDIPVKLFSMHLVLFSLILILFDGKRLLYAFILNRKAEPVEFHKIFIDKTHRYAIYVVKILFIANIVIGSTSSTWQRYQHIGPDREKPHLYGLWEVQSFAKDGLIRPPLITDDERWRYLIMEHRGRANIIRMDDDLQWYNAQTDTTQQTLHLTRGAEIYEFEFDMKDSSLWLEGEKDGESLVIELNRYDIENFLLLSRGFNWIQEFPYNR